MPASNYYVVAGIVAALILWAWRLRSDSVSRQGADPATSIPALSAMKTVLSNPALYTAGLLGLFHGLSQGGMISFVGQLYQTRFKIDPAQAAYFIGLNSGGLFGGRFVLSWITARWRIHELLVLTVCASGAAVAFVATILSPSYLWGVAMFTLAGAFVIQARSARTMLREEVILPFPKTLTRPQTVAAACRISLADGILILSHGSEVPWARPEKLW